MALRFAPGAAQLARQTKDAVLLGVIANGRVGLFRAGPGEVINNVLISGHWDLVRAGAIDSKEARGFSVVVKGGVVTALIRNSKLNPAAADYNLDKDLVEEVLKKLRATGARVYGN